MHYCIRPKDTELTDLVQSIWCYQSDPGHEFEQVLPGIHPQLLINLHESELRHWADPKHKLRSTGPVAVQGILTQPVTIDTMQKRNVCGVEFNSTGLSAFCNIGMTRFTDAIVDASVLWGSAAEQLHRELTCVTDAVERCRKIELFLLQQLQPKSDRDLDLINDIVRLMTKGRSITAISRHYNLSQRALHRLFEQRIGVRPKTFARVGRFGSTLSAIASQEPLVDVAIDSGYSDQAHLSREFRVFTGNTPTQHQPVANENRHAFVSADKKFKNPTQR